MKPIVINEVPELPIEHLSEDNAYPNRESDSLSDPNCSALKEARRAAEAHRRSRYRLQNLIKPGMSLNEITSIVEESTRVLLKGQRNGGIGFPTGVSVNSCAAHHTPNPDDKEVFLKEDDVLKIDFGTHVNGRIMDSAFTICFDPKYEKLLEASKEATEHGIRCLGIDVRVCDIGAEIEEVIRSFELEVNNGIYPIRPIENLNGHSIGQYQVHSGITLPIVRNKDVTRIVADTFYALETFATTGKGYVHNGKGCSHFILNRAVKRPLQNAKYKKTLKFIIENIGTLPFCPRYVDYLMKNKSTYKPVVDVLGSLRFLDLYPPLMDSAGSLVSQFEHTIYLSELGREVLTRGGDY